MWANNGNDTKTTLATTIMAMVIVKAHKDMAVVTEGGTEGAMVAVMVATVLALALALDTVRIPTLPKALLRLQVPLALAVLLSRTTARNGHSTSSRILNMLPTTMLNSNKLLQLLLEPLMIHLHHLHQVALLVLDIAR